MAGAIALAIVNILAIAVEGYFIWRLYKMASTANDVLREVSETTASNTTLIQSNTDLTAKVLELVSKATPGTDGSIVLTQDQADSITTSLQSVQDANAQAIDANNQTVAAINAVLTPPAEG